MVKIRPGALVEGSETYRLSIARGECQGFQVYVPPPASRVTASIEGPLLRGRKVPSRLYREGWIDVKIPSNSQGAVGRWPDPLIPVRDAYAGEDRSALPFDSTDAEPLVLYAELCVPSEAPAGRYLGKVLLGQPGQAPQLVPFQVEVLGFRIPATSTLPTTFGLSIYSIAQGHRLRGDSAEARALLRRYATALLAHRLSGYGLGIDPLPMSFEGGRAKVDFSGYDAEVGPFLEGAVLATGARFTTANVRDPPRAASASEKIAYYRTLGDHFAQKRWKVQLYFYAKDEPAPADYPLVLAQAEAVHQAGRIPVLITSPWNDVIGPAADILCPVLNCFYPKRGPATCTNVSSVQTLKSKLRPAAKVWWYQSCLSHGCNQGPLDDPASEAAFSGWASYMVDHPAALNRAMGVLAFESGVEGELYYDTTYAFRQPDPWVSIWEFGGNGDGTLFYPGRPERIGGKTPIPIESLRLKQIRDGLVDLEYLTLVAKTNGQLAQQIAHSVVQSGYQISTDPAAWQSFRLKLAKEIEAARR